MASIFFTYGGSIKTVNILGKGDGWDEIKQVKDGEIWGVNDAFLRTDCDKVFHMHDLNVFKEDDRTASSVRLTVQKANENPDIEFFTTVKFKDIPHAKEYPLDEITEFTGVNYFACTIDYCIAYAIYKGYEKIRLFGVNMSEQVEEYRNQKPSVEYWIGRAEGLGISVELQHKYTSIMKTRDGLLYGYLIDQWRM